MEESIIQRKKSSPDAVKKILEEYPDVFADIINGFIYNGKDVNQRSDGKKAMERAVRMYEATGFVSEEELAEAEAKGKALERYQTVDKLISKKGFSKEEAIETLEFTEKEMAGYEVWKISLT